MLSCHELPFTSMLCPVPTKEPNQKATEDKAEPSHQIEELPDEALSMATVLFYLCRSSGTGML
jgi:hypothetical protein